MKKLMCAEILVCLTSRMLPVVCLLCAVAPSFYAASLQGFQFLANGRYTCLRQLLPIQHPQKCRDHPGIKLLSCTKPELCPGLLVREVPLVHPGRGHGIVGVHDEENARRQRDRVACQPAGVACAIGNNRSRSVMRGNCDGFVSLKPMAVISL